MPSNVIRFEQLMYLSLGIGIVFSALQFQRLVSQSSVALILTTQAAVLGIMVLFIWLVARRRANWARWVLLVFFLLGLVPFIPYLSQTLQASPLSGSLSIAQLFAQGIALYLIFTGNAVEWFKKELSAGPVSKIFE